MNKFTSIDELRSVKRRLYFKKEELEAEMKNNFTSVKESFTPTGIFRQITGGVKKATTTGLGATTAATSGSGGLVNGAAAAMIDLLVNDLFLRRSSIFKKLITSYIIRVFGPGALNAAGPTIKNLIMKSGVLNMFRTKETADQ